MVSCQERSTAHPPISLLNTRYRRSCFDAEIDRGKSFCIASTGDLSVKATLYPLFAQFRDYAKKIGTIAIDGKTLCGSRDWDKNHPLHLLHAWSVEDGVFNSLIKYKHI